MADLLIVDDDPDISEAIAMLLEADGHTVRTAEHGEAGLRALDERLPALVISDVDMPELDGPAMAYRMLVQNCGRELVPIVLVSGSTNLPRIAARVGTRYVLAKPFSPDAVVALVRRALVERCPPTPRL